MTGIMCEPEPTTKLLRMSRIRLMGGRPSSGGSPGIDGVLWMSLVLSNESRSSLAFIKVRLKKFLTPFNITV